MKIILNLLIVTLVSSVLATSSYAYFTYPNSKRIKKTDPLRVFPAGEIPINYEDYTYQTFIPEHRMKRGEKNVPAYFRTAFGKISRSGTVPAGTTITFNGFTTLNYEHLYRIPMPSNFQPLNRNKNHSEEYIWIKGSYLKVTAYSGK